MESRLVVVALALVAAFTSVSTVMANEVAETAERTVLWPSGTTIRKHLDIGALVLDPPAGKHGRLTRVGGELVFADGKRTRLFGANIVGRACFPDRKQADEIADRLAFYGFNSVRLHHIDMGYAPTTLFRDVKPAAHRRESKPTGVVSKEQLAKLDYFIDALARRGIYTGITLLSHRAFTLADGVVAADKLKDLSPIGARPVSPHVPFEFCRVLTCARR